MSWFYDLCTVYTSRRKKTDDHENRNARDGDVIRNLLGSVIRHAAERAIITFGKTFLIGTATKALQWILLLFLHAVILSETRAYPQQNNKWDWDFNFYSYFSDSNDIYFSKCFFWKIICMLPFGLMVEWDLRHKKSNSNIIYEFLMRIIQIKIIYNIFHSNGRTSNKIINIRNQ